MNITAAFFSSFASRKGDESVEEIWIWVKSCEIHRSPYRRGKRCRVNHHLQKMPRYTVLNHRKITILHKSPMNQG